MGDARKNSNQGKRGRGQHMPKTVPFSAEIGFLIYGHSLTAMKHTDWLTYSTKAAPSPRTDSKA